MLKIGEKLPEFQVENQDGNLVKSSDFKGKKLVIFFYPKANTPSAARISQERLYYYFLSFEARRSISLCVLVCPCPSSPLDLCCLVTMQHDVT